MDGLNLSWRVFILLAIQLSMTGCALMFPKDAGEGLPNFAAFAPQQGEAPPHFSLTDLDGNSVSLDDLIGEQPIVVQLGSYSCPVFRYRRFDMRPLRAKYADRVTFVIIYTQEAHPLGELSPYSEEEWVPWINRVARIDVGQPETFSVRMQQARFAASAMNSNVHFLVDDMSNDTWRGYGAAPSAAFLLDLEGIVFLSQPWIYPKGLEAGIEELLNN